MPFTQTDNQGIKRKIKEVHMDTQKKEWNGELERWHNIAIFIVNQRKG
jgi:hypothetical protein